MLKKISAAAYQALRDAIPAIVWNKRPFETFLRTALRGNAELLVGLNFNEPKRVVADALVDRLIENEHRYRETTLQLMLEISSMNQFPNLELIKDPQDRVLRINEAEAAVGLLRYFIKEYANDISEFEKEEMAIRARTAQTVAVRRFGEDLDSLKARFLELQVSIDVHARGYALESLLNAMFVLFDLEPRLCYSTEIEQIDGSFTFDTDDYIIEARWRAKPADRGDGDIFAKKVERKGKNAVGLFISINGFTDPFKQAFRESTPFISADGADIYTVLDNRMRLDDLIRAKKRHANETGSCYLPASQIIA